MSTITGKSSPRDAQVMAAILKDMGVSDYEPRVINQMLEFAYRYVTDILDDAKVYSSHANKKNVDSEDVRLAIQCKLDHSFTTPPPRDLLMDIARHKNNNPLPLMKPYSGIKLPPDRYCLSQANYRLRPHQKKPQPHLVQVQGTSILPSMSSRLQSSGSTSLIKPGGGASSLGGPSLTLVSRTVSQTPVSIRPANASAAPMPIIRVNPGGPNMSLPGGATMVSLKRKRDDDDDYDKP